MARHEADREDLWAEAVGMTSRAELLSEPNRPPVIVGFRPNGWFSLYFGQDLMLQFTLKGSLRRAYRDGDLFRTQGTTVSRLRRHRTDSETTLLRHDLSRNEFHQFKAWAKDVLAQFRTDLIAGKYQVECEVNVLPRPLMEEVHAALERILATEQFLAPAIKGKK